MSKDVDNYFEQTGNDGDNKLVLGGSVETAGGSSLKTQVVAFQIDDVSTAGQAYFYAPFAGTLTKVTSVLNGPIATNDDTLTVKTQAGTAGTITIANAGSAAGDVDSLTVTTNGEVTAGSLIEIETDGASTNAVSANITLEIALS